MTISQIGVLSCVLLGLCLVGRILFLCRYRVPVLGQVIRHDYDEATRRFEWGGDLGDWSPTEGFHLRSVCARISYHYKDIEYRNDIELTVMQGTEPESLLRLWINPANPKQVTAQGPGHWFMWLVLTAAFAGVFWNLPF